MSDEYHAFLHRKAQITTRDGFQPNYLPDHLFDFQKDLVEWAVMAGRGALFADTGLGKTAMQLAWAENVVRHTNGRVLILAPLAVAPQTVREGAKFGSIVNRSHNGRAGDGITIANYERLHLFDPADFEGMVCDESSILKSFDGVRRSEITAFMRKMRYRLLCTATAAPNDYVELGTSSEALGFLGHTDMLQRFFKNDQNTVKPMVYRNKGQDFAGLRERAKWRFKGHAEDAFWRWVCSWARAVRRPSDLGFSDDRFILPPLVEREHSVYARTLPPGKLFALPAFGLHEQREERRRTINERCEKAAELVAHDQPAIMWCHLNPEGDLLEKLVPDAVQVSGRDSDDAKEEKLGAFVDGKARVLVIKPKIGAWGLNFQHCAHLTMFPSHSFEQYYQAVRRCWRYGQTRKVACDMVSTEGDKDVLKNLQAKARAADRMFSRLVAHMQGALHIDKTTNFTTKQEIPTWL